MSLKINCILNQPSALPDLIKLVEKTAHSLNANKKSAKVDDVYREIRDSMVEIDAESVALAYQNVQGIMGKKGFSTQADVRRFGGESLKKAIRIANEGDLIKSRAGKASVSRTVASGIAKTFSTLEGNNDVDKSRLIKLQDALRRAANSMLDKTGYVAKAKPTFQELLESALDVENISKTGTEAMNGRVKSAFENMDAIWADIQDDINKIGAGINDKAQRARFEQLTSQLKSSSYDLLLGSTQADSVVKGTLKEAGFVKQVEVNGVKKNVVDWNKALSSQNDWRNDFALVLRKNGFDIAQTQRILDRLEGNYQKAIQKQAENKLNEVNKRAGKSAKVDREAIRRLISLKNAGIFLPNNQATLAQALGYEVPQDVADRLSSILSDYEANMSNGNAEISNVFKEEVKREVNNLLAPLNRSGLENVIGNMEDYFGLRASSTIATAFNTLQNVTSGINNTMIPAFVAIARTRNVKLMGTFIKQWVDTLADVTMGGVSPRDSKTTNLNQFENRGGLSDRWNIDNAKGFFGYFKAAINILGQATATAADAANGTVIYDVEMIAAARDILTRREGKSSSEANKIIDDIIFGQHSSGVSNRQFWQAEAKKMIENQDGVKDRAAKARRIAEELKWNKLTEYGLTVNEIKRMMSASLSQMSRNLGHQSDVYLSPATILGKVSTGFSQAASQAKQKGNRIEYLSSHLAGSVFKAINMFAGGKVNWAILTLQNSPVGVGIGLFDIAAREAIGLANKETPLYRQAISTDETQMEQQMRDRKAIFSRLERGIVGSAVQMIGYIAFMAMLGGADDDDRKKRIKDTFTDYMKDPKTKRLMDKAAPMLLASELQYAWDNKNQKFIEKRIGESLLLPHYITSGSMGDFYDTNIKPRVGYDYLQDALKYNAKISNEDKRHDANNEAWASYIGGLLQLPYTGWFNVEQDEIKLVNNGFSPDPSAGNEARKKFKIQKDNIDGISDAFINGVLTSDIVQGKEPERVKK